MPSLAYIPALRFHALTGFYDPVVRLMTCEDAFKRVLVAGLRPDLERILDVGCGTGTLLAMLRASHPDAALFGIDIDAQVLDLARAKLADDVSLHLGSATGLAWESASFDCVVSSLAFHHLKRAEKLKSLEAIRRVLRSGGEFHLADWGPPHGPLMRLAFLGVRLVDGIAVTRDHVAGNIPTLMKAAGFRGVRVISSQRTPLGSLYVYRGVA